MSLPYCQKHNVSWAAGKECPDCVADALQARVRDLEAKYFKIKAQRGDQIQSLQQTIFNMRGENALLRKALELIAKPNLSLADSDGLYRQEIAEKALRELDGEKITKVTCAHEWVSADIQEQSWCRKCGIDD